MAYTGELLCGQVLKAMYNTVQLACADQGLYVWAAHLAAQENGINLHIF